MPTISEMNSWTHRDAVYFRRKLEAVQKKIEKCEARLARYSGSFLYSFFMLRKRYLLGLLAKWKEKLAQTQRICWSHNGPWEPGGPSFSICPNCFLKIRTEFQAGGLR